MTVETEPGAQAAQKNAKKAQQTTAQNKKTVTPEVAPARRTTRDEFARRFIDGCPVDFGIVNTVVSYGDEHIMVGISPGYIERMWGEYMAEVGGTPDEFAGIVLDCAFSRRRQFIGHMSEVRLG